ncbi:unnamed protein product [Acanthoscelides obtectus]|uniref:Uncharacterized protein n=1 Tax=Acanthoscelides obtectus TaxID=200917 RepID=A0A9P0MI22_ACAOB|nr:unnamed protein product [Acanthoscelides obtectus]CAK1669281.1 hypothetical protein AOBTE_LOCUS26922 [Acanthoscelides obtectus]
MANRLLTKTRWSDPRVEPAILQVWQGAVLEQTEENWDDDNYETYQPQLLGRPILKNIPLFLSRNERKQ